MSSSLATFADRIPKKIHAPLYEIEREFVGVELSIKVLKSRS